MMVSYDGWGGWALMMLVMVAFWVLIALAIVALIRFGPSRYHDRGLVGPLESLQLRFARGEITEEEYLRARTMLQDSRR